MTKRSKPKHSRKAPKGMPVLRGFVSEDRKMINVWCPYCQKFHYHGWNPENPSWAVEDRGPHCFTDNPFRPRGYWIGEITPAQLRGTYR